MKEKKTIYEDMIKNCFFRKNEREKDNLWLWEWKWW